MTSPSVGSTGSSLSDVITISTTDVWAAGSFTQTNGYQQTLIEYLNGTAWSVVSSPNIGAYSNVLEGVTTVSANDIWAIGYYYDNGLGMNQTLIEHWNGTQWILMQSSNPNPKNNFLSDPAQIPGTTSVWSVGNTGNGTHNQTLTEFRC